jgi:molecular chaperone HscA
LARAIGIDLGTTSSLVAAVDGQGRPRVIEAEEGRRFLASAVYYGVDGSVEVGAAARRRAPERPADTILSVKRLMGRAPSELGPEDRGIYRYEESGPAVRIAVSRGTRVVTPVEVSAEILRVLRRRAAQALEGQPGGCVIAVPAWFDEAQRQATRDAGRLAGLEVLRLLHEPTAAALAYGLEMRSRGTFAVYDLGGGAFGVSILKLVDGAFQVLATAGDARLGGDDLDRALARWLLGGAATGVDPSPALLRGSLDAARDLREALSFRDEVQADLELPGGRRLKRRIQREDLEEHLRPFVERTSAPCQRALRAAALEGRSVDGVVLVGGVTRTPLVRRHVRKLFGLDPFTDVDPDAVVALGAAIHADVLERGGDASLQDPGRLSASVD